MTQRIEVEQPAEPGATFAPDAFAGQIGKTVPLTIEGRAADGGCKVVGAQVADDGSSVSLTLEVADDALPQPTITPGSFSLR